MNFDRATTRKLIPLGLFCLLLYFGYGTYQSWRQLRDLRTTVQKHRLKLEQLPDVEVSESTAKDSSISEESRSFGELLEEFGTIQKITFKESVKESRLTLDRESFPAFFNRLNRRYRLTKLSLVPRQDDLRLTVFVSND